MNPLRKVAAAVRHELGGRHRPGKGRSRELSARRRPNPWPRCPSCQTRNPPPLCLGCGCCPGCVDRCKRCNDCVVLCPGHKPEPATAGGGG